MLARCGNANHAAYPRYGGRGITVCERWQKFENFLADMGERPGDLTLDRIDNDRGYEPGNCRWTTRAVQVRNRGATKLTEAQVQDIRRLLASGALQREAAARYGVTRSHVSRIANQKIWV